MFKSEVLIGKGVSVVDVDYSRAIVMDKVSSLNHEVLYNTMIAGSFVTHWNPVRLVFTDAELSKVLSRFWCNISKELENYSAYFSISNAYIQENLKRNQKLFRVKHSVLSLIKV